MAPTGVAFHGVRFAHPGDVPILDGLDLAAPGGRITAILGPSGTGKSTALRLVAGHLAPQAGRVTIGGADQAGLAPEARGAAMMFQDARLFPSMSVAQNVGFGLRMRRVPRAEARARVEAMLERVRLPGFGPRPVASLSGGQAQRVALARALVTAPRVLLLDEPLAALDAHLRGEMRALLAELQAETGVSMLLVTHDREEAVALGHVIALLGGGRCLQAGPPEDLYERPQSVEVARFFGMETFLPGRMSGGVFEGPLGPLAAPDLPEGPCTLTIRPEAVTLGPGPNPVEAVVREARYLGTHGRVVAEARCGVEIPAIVPAGAVAGLAPGAPVTLALPPDRLRALPPQ